MYVLGEGLSKCYRRRQMPHTQTLEWKKMMYSNFYKADIKTN